MSERDLGSFDIAVVHGNYLGRGGGERVAETIARTFDAPIYYGFGYEKYEPDDIPCHSLFNDTRGSSFIKENPPLRDLQYFRKFRNVPELHEADVIIQSGNEMGWYQPPDDQVIVKYTHSTPRNAYDRYPKRASDRGVVFESYTFATRLLYRMVVPYPDIYVANSEVVERRLNKYWDKQDVSVVYPPVEVETYGSEYASESPIDGDYYLALDRIEPSKHIDRIVESFQDLPHQLVVAGDGSMHDELAASVAGDESIQFRGYVPEDEKRALMAGAEALVYAAEDEDFGIVPAEALASGTPVIGPREGFTEYQIQDGLTGYLYDSSVDGLTATVEKFERDGISSVPAELEQFADQFAVDRFQREMREAVAAALKQAHIDPQLDYPERRELTT